MSSAAWIAPSTSCARSTEEEFRRRQGRELNKGEAAHDLSRFLFFGKQGELRGRSFDDQFRSFSCLGVLHNAVVAWNIIHVGKVVAQLRAEGHAIDDATLALTTPLMHKHLNPFGRYQFDLARMRQTVGGHPLNGGFRAIVPNTRVRARQLDRLLDPSHPRHH